MEAKPPEEPKPQFSGPKHKLEWLGKKIEKKKKGFLHDA